MVECVLNVFLKLICCPVADGLPDDISIQVDKVNGRDHVGGEVSWESVSVLIEKGKGKLAVYLFFDVTLPDSVVEHFLAPGAVGGFDHDSERFIDGPCGFEGFFIIMVGLGKQ